MRALFARIREILRDRHLRRIWTRVISVMASVVVFISTYALILPAITMESEAACGIEAHQHTDECYEDVLTCGQEESEDHQHTDACYTRTLICGKEAHIHSAECYKEDRSAVAESGGTAVPAVTDGSAGDSSSDQSSGNHQTGQTSQPTQVDVSDASGPAADADGQGAGAEMSGTPEENAGTTVTAEGLPADANTLSDGTGYVPVLDILNFDSLLTKETGFYYFHAEEGQPVPENSSAITDWEKLKNNMTLASTDLVKAYLAYSIPAGALNETNQTARYRLPANLHLTDDQIQAINRTENGVAAAFAAAENGSGNDSGNGNSESAADGSENTDSGITGAGEADAAAGYEKYLGAEAVEGTRTPDKTLREGAQEYISATVRAENVYEGMLDENGNYIDFAGTQASPASDRKDLGDYIGQDLIFTFTPYTVQKNQNTYDMEGNPLTAGEKVTGWFAVDFNMDQIDWVEEDTDLDKSTIEKSAEVIFALEDAGIGSKERKTTLRLEEQAPAGENGTEDTADQDKAADENADLNKTDKDATDSKDAEENAEKAVDVEDAEKAADHTDGTITADGDGYSITLAYTADAQIPENASLSVKEITPDTDPEAYEACLQQAAQKMGASIPESGNAGANADVNAGAAGDAADSVEAGKPALDTAASRFFDIEIVVTNDDGKTEKIEPKAPVAVNIQLSSAPEAATQDKAANAAAKSAESGKSGEETSVDSAQKADPTVLHFAEDGVEEMDATVAAPADGNTANSQKNETGSAGAKQADNAAGTTEISFEAESFSVYGVVYTVDFEYSVNGKVYQYSLSGGGSMALSDLVEVLGIINDTSFDTINEFMSNVKKVEFTDPELVKVTKDSKGNDWTLKSLNPFDSQEELTITMKNGDVIKVDVTDARKPKLTNTYSGLTIVKKWYRSDGTEITGEELTDDYKCDFVLQGWEYNPADVIRLHFIDSYGHEDTSKTVIVPAGKLQLTLYNTPVNGYGGGGTAYLFSEAPTETSPINNPTQNINLLTDSAITVKNVKLDDGSTINTWVVDLNLSDYVNELTDVYLGIQPDPDNGGIEYFKSTTFPDTTAAINSTDHAMKIAYTDIGNWQNDTYRNRHIFDTIKGTNNTYVWHNNELELTSAGGKFFGYTIYESSASTPDGTGFTTSISWNNGADEIYTNGLSGWSAELYINSPNLDNNVITIKNTLRDDVDVPVEKHWPWMDQYVRDRVYDWEAKFVLQWAPVYEGETVPSTDFVEVEPHQYITITSQQMENFGATFDERKFFHLPLYGEDEKGKFRYEYSVEEESYTVKNHNSGEVVAAYDRHGSEGNKYTGNLPEFIPYYPHDAGELSANPSDYMIMVTNALAPDASDPTINITVNKNWDDEKILEDDKSGYHSTVKIQRYDQTSTRTFNSDYNPNAPEMVTVYVKQNNETVKTLTVTKGVAQRIHISLTSPGYGTANFACSSDNPNISLFNINDYSLQPTYPDGTAHYPELNFYSDEFYPVDGMIINITSNSANGGVAVNLQENFSIEEEAFSDPAPDTDYNNDEDNTFTLSLLENRWSTIITDLPLTKTITNGNTQIIHHYSYYFVEDEANTEPSGYTPTYVRYDTVGTGREFEIGDRGHRINYDGEHVTINNIKKKFRVKKEWRGIQRSEWYMYPAVKFDLYKTRARGQTGERIQAGIELSNDNGWEWSTEELDPNYYYYVVEDMSFDTQNRYQLWEYYNSDGIASLRDQPYNHAINNEGTITILNALRNDNQYIQTYMQKKWMEWETPYSWATTTSSYKRLHDLVMGFIVDRRAWELGNNEQINDNLQYPDSRIISGGNKGWEPFGNEMLAGYDSNGNPVLDKGGNNFTVYYSGTWHWTILQGNNHDNYKNLEIGLPSEGWYKKADGTVVWAKFEYIIRETGIWKDLKKNPVEDPEISWFSNVVPINAKSGNGEHHINEFNRDIGQDPLRIMNGAGYDLWVEKDWVGGNFDAREVYVKIYRKLQQGGNLEDFTEELARDVDNNGLIGYLSGNYANMIDVDNKWVVFTPSSAKLYIDKVLKTHPNASGSNLYEYWLQEVGYKDKHGQVHMYTGNGTNQSDVNTNDLTKLTPTYTGIQLNNGNNIGITLSGKGQNTLGITNTPVRDFAVIKKWKNSLGEDISDEVTVNELKISITQTRTRQRDGKTVTQPVMFNNNEQLTLTSGNSANSVVLAAQNHPGETGSQNYSYTNYQTNQNIGPWALYISGLEENYSDEAGDLWVCNYKINEDPNSSIPSDFVTEVSYDGLIDRDNRNITISNIKMEGGMLKVTKEIADGSDYDTEDPFKITVKLTPQGNQEEVFSLGSVGHPHEIKDYIEVDETDTILIGSPEIIVDDDKTVTITMTLAGRGSFTIRDIKEGTSYLVTEGSTPGWRQVGEVSYSNTQKTIVKRQLDTATIVNEESAAVPMGIKIIKIDETSRTGTQKKLGAAEFTLLRRNDESRYVVYPDAAQSVKTTSTEEGESYGTLTFDELPDGQYKLIESKQPPGYTKNEVNDIFFDIESGVLTRYDKEYGASGRTVIAESAEVVNVTYVKENNDSLYASFFVGNEPGQPLPSTGGPGTGLFTLLGAALITGAGMLLWRRRRLF